MNQRHEAARSGRMGFVVTLIAATFLMGSSFVAGKAILITSYATGVHWPNTTGAAQWGWFLWLAIPASTGSFGLWFVALSKGGATRTSAYLFLAPMFAVILSFFILGSTLTWLQAVGGFLIGLALWLVNRESPARTRQDRLTEAHIGGEP